MFILIHQDLRVYGIFDGHGPYGHKVSSYVQTRMVQMISESLKITNSEGNNENSEFKGTGSMFNRPGNQQSSKDIFEGLTLESIIEPYYFEEAKRALIEIFLTIQDELETNYEIFLSENFPEDNPSESSSPKEERKSKFINDEEEKRSSMSSSFQSKPTSERDNFKSTIISLK